MVQEYSTEAILLTVRDCGAADRVVTLFSPVFGKITATAFGARRSKNKMVGSLQPFAHVDLMLARGKVYDTIKQCETRTSFRALREDLLRMAYSMLITEIVSEMWPEREADAVTFTLLLDVLPILANRNPRLTALAGAWQLLALAGFGPNWNECRVCGKEVTYPAFFDIEAGGVVGKCCLKDQSGNLTEQLAQLIRHLTFLNWHNPGKFTVNKLILMGAERLLKQYLTHHLEKPLKSLDFIAQIEVQDKNY